MNIKNKINKKVIQNIVNHQNHIQNMAYKIVKDLILVMKANDTKMTMNYT